MLRIKTIQTRDCYYPIYFVKETNFNFNAGYYFLDDEMQEYGETKGEFTAGYFGPYATLDFACKAQHRHYVSVMSL